MGRLASDVQLNVNSFTELSINHKWIIIIWLPAKLWQNFFLNNWAFAHKYVRWKHSGGSVDRPGGRSKSPDRSPKDRPAPSWPNPRVPPHRCRCWECLRSLCRRASRPWIPDRRPGSKRPCWHKRQSRRPSPESRYASALAKCCREAVPADPWLWETPQSIENSFSCPGRSSLFMQSFVAIYCPTIS